MKRPTFAQTRSMLLAGLRANGWTVKSDLKVPHATKGEARVWFKPQAIYFAIGTNDLRWARSLSSDMREFADVGELLRLLRAAGAS